MGGTTKAWKKVKRSVYPKSTTGKKGASSSDNPYDLSFNPFDDTEKATPKRSNKKSGGIKKVKNFWEKKVGQGFKTVEQTPSVDDESLYQEHAHQLSPITADLSAPTEVSFKEGDNGLEVIAVSDIIAQDHEEASVNPYGITEIEVDRDEDNESTLSPLTLNSGHLRAYVIDISEQLNHTLKLPSLCGEQDLFKEAEELVYGTSRPRIARSSGTREEPDHLDDMFAEFDDILKQEQATSDKKESTKGQADDPIDLTKCDYRLFLRKPADSVNVGMIEDADEAYEDLIRDSQSVITKTTHKLFGPNGTWYRR